MQFLRAICSHQLKSNVHSKIIRKLPCTINKRFYSKEEKPSDNVLFIEKTIPPTRDAAIWAELRNPGTKKAEREKIYDPEEEARMKQKEEELKKMLEVVRFEGEPRDLKIAPKLFKNRIFEYLDPLHQNRIPEISLEDVQKLVENPPGQPEIYYLIDVRNVERAGDFSIPHSVNIPLVDIESGALNMHVEAFYDRYGIAFPDYADTIVFYSDDPDESEMAAVFWTAYGYCNVFNYAGGVKEYFKDTYKKIWVKEPAYFDRLKRIKKEYEWRRKLDQ